MTERLYILEHMHVRFQQRERLTWRRIKKIYRFYDSARIICRSQALSAIENFMIFSDCRDLYCQYLSTPETAEIEGKISPVNPIILIKFAAQKTIEIWHKSNW
jgi:hypothetical protein